MSSRKRRERRALAQGRRVEERLIINGQEFVDRQEYMPPGWGFNGGFGGFGMNLMTSLNDRKDGKNAPFVESENDANTIRGFARFVTTANCPGVGILKLLVNYIIGRGIKPTVSVKKGRKSPEGLAEFSQDLVDEFNEDNRIIGNFDRESCRRDHRDGEGYVGLYPKNKKTHLRTLEPENVVDPITAPFTDEDISQNYGLMLEHPTVWHWGHHADEHDPINTHGYCIRWGSSEPFDYLPARYVFHSKADDNVDRATPRGMSDFMPAWAWLRQQERLLRNAGEGAAELAAIAYITQFANATQEQVRSMRQNQADYEFTRTGANGSSNTTYKHRREPGSVVSIPQGQEFKEAPMGADRGQAFIQVVQGILRQVATCWGLTEGMISGDDSNNTMASSVEAGSRFWKYADSQQGLECAKWKQIYSMVLRNAYDMGLYERFQLTWEDIRRTLEITVDCPEIDVRDPLTLAQTRQIDKANGALSSKTWSNEAGYDYDKEVSQGAKDEGGMGPGSPGGGFGHPGAPDGPGGGPGGVPGVPGGPAAPQLPRQPGEWEDKSRMQWKRNVKAITDVVTALQAKSISAIQAKVQLGMLGMNPDRIDSLLADVADDGLVNDPQNVQDLAESFAGHCSSRGRIVYESNPNHEPAGSSQGGEFASGGGSSGGGASSSKSSAALPKHVEAAVSDMIKQRNFGDKYLSRLKTRNDLSDEQVAGVKVRLDDAKSKIDSESVMSGKEQENNLATHASVSSHLREKYGVPDSSDKSAAAYYRTPDGVVIRVADHAPVHARSTAHVNVVTAGDAHQSWFHPDTKVVDIRGKTPDDAKSAVDNAIQQWTAKIRNSTANEAPQSGRQKRTETREFKKWFGDSKVVDDAGKPLVVYHGTADDFEVFAHGQAGRANTSDSKLAHFFSSNADVADEWTWKKGEQTGSIKPVFLKMENPLVVNGTKYYDPKHHLASVQKAIDGGHDGVIFKGQGSLTGTSDHYAVIDPRNIKSASGNQGTYNSKTGHIGESRALEVGNPNHAPAGDDHGGEFTSDGGQSGPAAPVTGRKARSAKRAQANQAVAKAVAGDHTSSPAFKQWFGQSKLVDDAGKPLTLYHSTDADFTEFNAKFSRKTDIKGFYFGLDKTPHVTVGNRKNILAVHIRMENPATMEDVQRVAKESGARAPQLHAALKKAGYDGVYAPKDKMVIAFDPQQIKSATGNAGTFSPKSKNIYESRFLGTGLDPFINYP